MRRMILMAAALLSGCATTGQRFEWRSKGHLEAGMDQATVLAIMGQEPTSIEAIGGTERWTWKYSSSTWMVFSTQTTQRELALTFRDGKLETTPGTAVFRLHERAMCVAVLERYSDGYSPESAERLLGPPDRKETLPTGELVYHWRIRESDNWQSPPHDVFVRFTDGRVSQVDAPDDLLRLGRISLYPALQ